MLTDPKEIAIIQGAKQKNVRDPNRSREHFHNILKDFFAGVKLTGTYLDMGPGQYDFGMLAREQGGSCHAIDFDPAVIELGTYKGFQAIEMNIQHLPKRPLGRLFDGVFNKFTLNAFWGLDEPGAQGRLIDSIVAHMTPQAWAWIGPWNGVPKSAPMSAAEIARHLDEQRKVFEGHGFTTCSLSGFKARRYGIHGDVANNVVFVKNLVWHP
jgi:hypothetical protein